MEEEVLSYGICAMGELVTVLEMVTSWELARIQRSAHDLCIALP